MRAISKGLEPIELLQYRAQPGAIYDGNNFTTVKNRIRETLLSEQDHLCAYCMQRITADSMKVEHWHSQTGYPGEHLAYGNMLGCCPGNEGSPSRDQHCDTLKADSDISCNPADLTHQPRMRIRYAGDGTIRSDNIQFDVEINTILNLNWVRLKNNRQSVWKAVTQVLSINQGSRTRREVQSLIDRWNLRDADGCLKEYCAVAIYYLEKKLRKLG